MDKRAQSLWIDEKLAKLGLARPTTYALPDGRQSAWRVSPAPAELSMGQVKGLVGMASVLRSFYAAADKLYHLGLTDRRYEFVPGYLDQGKPARIIAVGREARFKGVLPLVMRPDLLWTEHGYVATEFDSIPGGVGLLAGMEALYQQLGFKLPNTAANFAQAVKSIHKKGLFAIVVSEECSGYRGEMQYLATCLRESGVNAHCLRPEELQHRSGGVYFSDQRVATLYRFFELFDIDNVPYGWEMLEAAAQGLVKMTPPPKAYLEEKLWFALIHHPVLMSYWRLALGETAYEMLCRLVPRSFVLDPRPVPPHAVIAGLTTKGQVVNSFRELLNLPRSERGYVLKPSGFSPKAWGSRGVILGKELTTKAWGCELERALASFSDQPLVLQEYHASISEPREFLDYASDQMKAFVGKSRYCPYFFNTSRNTLPGGMLVTTCPLDKPLIHGMTDAVLLPGAW